MGFNDEQEGLNLPQSNLSEFFDDMEGKLALLTGLVNKDEFGLTLEDVRKPLLVVGKPGIGKTCGIISSIKEMNKKLPKEKQLGFKKILLGQTVVGSLSGIPVSQPDGSIVRVQIPDLPNPERDGEYGVLFLDEITTADEMQIQPALGLADDSRSLGEYSLPEHWIVVGAGNGPDCTNFVRLDDMTISRFVAYDINYNYTKDFRPYAHKVELHEDIIAFLNFNPEICIRTESTDMDSAGKMFPCPRTWERLSTELKMQQARGREIDPDQMSNFAGRIVGLKAGREFGAFLQYKKTLKYDAKKILDGNEKDPEVGMPKEQYHIILQALFKQITNELKSYGSVDDVPLEMYKRCGNMISWLLKFHELENKINAIIEIRDDLPQVAALMFDDLFCSECCPELDAFIEENMELLNGSMADLDNMKL
jgi:hypothetical protein